MRATHPIGKITQPSKLTNDSNIQLLHPKMAHQVRVASGVEHGPLVPDVVHHGEGVLRPHLDHLLQGDELARFGVLEGALKPQGHQDDDVLHLNEKYRRCQQNIWILVSVL